MEPATQVNKIVLKGFKTFKNKTSIPFYEGLTAIVGENGSGKSNLVEAISFVMGRRSSQLRAERLEQLIFNGGDHQKPADHAQVTLHLDNQDGIFDQFLENGQAKEITIGRKVTRGYSTYRFMGKNCRREQIDQILEAAHIDPDGQHFIEQGKVTDIIKKTPPKRRAIIDDISGVSVYEEKKERSIGKLREVKEKLNTNRIILAERRSRLRGLRNEREAALEYQKLKEEKAALEASIHHLKKTHLESKLRRAAETKQALQEEIDRLEEQKSDLSLKLKNLEWELEELREKMDGKSEVKLVRRCEQIRTQIVRKKGQIHTKQSKIESLQETLEELKEMAKRYRSSPGNRAVKVLLELGKEGIYGTIAQLMVPKEGYEVAIDIACGGHKQDLVMDSRDTALESINYLKKNNLGRVRILPMDKLYTPSISSKAKRAKNLEGVFDLAINLVQFDEKYRPAFKYVLRDTLVAESLEAVRDLEGVRVVTLDGDILSPGGAVTGGKAVKKKGSERMRRYEINRRKKNEQIEKLKNEIEEAKREIKDLEKKLKEKEQKTEDKSTETEKLRAETKRKSAQLKDVKSKHSQITSKLESKKRELTRAESKIESLRDELKDIDMEKPDSSQDLVEGSMGELEKRLKEAIRGMERLTPVNMKAIQEYDQFKKDLEVLEGKVEDLRGEKKKIETFIGEIEAKKKEEFMRTLEQISGEFNSVFQKLFEGGEASLQLEEPGNIESGLLIRAHPPSKEPHVLDSLSGGEKVLTAIAFIFAIQKYHKSPICVMDEIDAALDKTNSQRISKLLKEYSREAQLIMVSHNQETVQMADRAYGVSIRDGVSKVLSIDLN